MRKLFNDGWEFFELPLDENTMYKDGAKVLLSPDQFFTDSLKYDYKKVRVPHDWMIGHIKDLYKNSVGLYKKTFELNEKQCSNQHVALYFEGVYMNSAVYVNGKKAGEWKYGYTAFEFDISDLVQPGQNLVQVIAVYQNCNTRWYSGAGIFRDVTLISTPKTFLASDGVYFSAKKADSNPDDKKWNCYCEAEVTGDSSGCFVKSTLTDKNGKIFWQSNENPVTFEVSNPLIWDIDSPDFYILKTELFSADGKLLDELSQHAGFKSFYFDKENGFFLNGRHVKINGACQHHDLGALGSAFDVNALYRQFFMLKEMGVNSVRCSHNPPPKAWMNLADEMGILIDDECFDMWEKPKTPFDYGNYFNEWCERDVESWVKKDRNHPSLFMWSIGNEIHDTHIGNGLAIVKRLSKAVRKFDPKSNAIITMASNYMWSDNAQECSKELEAVGYNYLERLYDEHHQKYQTLPNWKIYGSETSSTVQSRGVYHFPESLQLITFTDGQCSCLGNCTVPWGAKNTQAVVTIDRDISYSAGQYIWTGWDYIGEPTPYHTKNSYFGQIDTAGFPKDTYFLYKSEWAGNKAAPFVHLLPYWDWNEGQLIDIKAYTNCDSVELFYNDASLGKQNIDHEHSERPFGQWQLVYHPGEIKVIGYVDGRPVAEEIKRSFTDPAKILIKPENLPSLQETADDEATYFIDLMTADKNDELVENARNYITFNVTGKAQLVGIDNGDSTDYDEYQPASGNSLSRKLFNNRLVAIVRAKKDSSFVITAASKDLPTVSLKYDGKSWKEVAPYYAIRPEIDYVPVRKIELSTNKNEITAKVLPKNATDKTINWNPVLKECVPSDNFTVSSPKEIEPGIFTAQIEPQSDGEAILRCTAKNGTDFEEIISDIPVTVSGHGNKNLNPYKLIEGCRFTDFDHSKNEPAITLESGVSTRNAGPMWMSFSKVDFGPDGADTIHLPIFAFETELPVEIYDGNDGECLGKFTYRHESIYNTYSENVFTLTRRLFGVHTIKFAFQTDMYFKGFYFDKTPKATSKLRALDADLITGDSFEKSPEKGVIEKIGNNVTLDFSNMDFGTEKATKLTVCGKSNVENNSINVKFFDDDGKSTTQVFDFPHTQDYEEKTFEIKAVTGKKKISFVFLPGSNFDFKWFKFD